MSSLTVSKKNIFPMRISAITPQTISRFSLSAAVFLFICYCGYTLYGRIVAERMNRQVELCVTWEEVSDICALQHYEVSDFLRRLKAIGVRSIALKEDTMRTLAANGRLLPYPAADFNRIQLLDILSPAGKVKKNCIIVPHAKYAEYLGNLIQTRYGLSVTRDMVMKQTVLYLDIPAPVPSFWNDDIALGFDPLKIALMREVGLTVVLRPQNRGNVQWLADYSFLDSKEDAPVLNKSKLPENSAVTPVLPLPHVGYLWDDEVPGFPDTEQDIAGIIEQQQAYYYNLEFVRCEGEQILQRMLPHRLVQGHTIPLPELNASVSVAKHTARWIRAVKERGNRFLFFHFWPNHPVEFNIDYIRTVAQRLKQEGYILESANAPGYPQRCFRQVLKYVLILSACIFPLAGLYVGLILMPMLKMNHSKAPPVSVSPWRWLSAYGAANGITLVGAISVTLLTYDLLYMQRIEALPWIKGLLIVPLIGAACMLFSFDDIRRFLNAHIRVSHALIILMGVVLVSFLVLRSGNNSSIVFPFELSLRQALEDILWVRPRTKEFLWGQPLLMLGFLHRKKYLVWLGMIGQVSIINTFLHAHTPFLISLTRTVHGIWLGLLIGGMVAVGLWCYQVCTGKKGAQTVI